MRAVLIKEIKDLNVGEDLAIGGPNAHHLIKVARVKLKDKVLILNGKGLKGVGEVIEIEKKNLTIEIESYEYKEKKSPSIAVALGMTKKEAFELMIKEASEFGVDSIYPFDCEYGQNTALKEDRVSALVESATIQSNNPFYLNFETTRSFEDLKELVANFDLTLYMTPKKIGELIKGEELKKFNSILLIVGPEGGLSLKEEEELSSWKKVKCLNLNTPILRSPTAMAGGLGYLFGNLQ